MKKTISTIALILATLTSISQTASDSITCLPNSKLRKAIKEIENCKIVKEELTLTQTSVGLLENRVAVKDSIINTYALKDSIAGVRFGLYEESIRNLKKQVANEQAISTIYAVKLKTAKINKWIFGGSGLLIGLGALFILK